MAELDYDEIGESPGFRARLQRVANVTGALVSIGLIAGLAVWGYRLTMRDVTGVPVIRALEGPMRIAPEDPGGSTTNYQGLAVNRVAAEGEAAPPADTLVLAPRSTGLSDEDLAAADLNRTAEAPPLPDEPGAAEADISRALAEALDTPAPEAPAETVERVAAQPAPQTIGPPARLSPDLRPVPRPARLARAAAGPAAPVPAAAAAVPEEIDPSRLRAGARLVQLGAFDDAETARREWARLTGRFGSYMAGKSRVVQEAETGGRRFFRLRAAGFADEAEARRFCSALLAEQAACIPVSVR